MPTMTIFAGINGVGKSTLYKELIDDGNNFGMRINPDEILLIFKGDWQKIKDIREAAHITKVALQDSIENQIDFNWETTVITKNSIKIIKQAKEAGFKIVLNFIGTDDIVACIERVHGRVSDGGHGVSTSLLEKRYKEQFLCFDNLGFVDEINLYSNVHRKKIVAKFENGKCVFLDENCKWIKENGIVEKIEGGAIKACQ